MGKTAVLREIARLARQRLGWAVAIHHCRAKQRALGQVADEVLSAIQRRWPTGQAFATEVLGPRAARTFEGSHPAGRDLARNLTALPRSVPDGAGRCWSELVRVLQAAGDLAAKQGRGVLVAIDDADLLSVGEAESLAHMAGVLSRQGLPVALALTGGPEIADRFRLAGHLLGIWPTYLEAFEDYEVREALVVPASDRGVDFDEDALQLACQSCAGAPLLVQRLGFAAWSFRRAQGTIGLSAMQAAARLVTGRFPVSA